MMSINEERVRWNTEAEEYDREYHIGVEKWWALALEMFPDAVAPPGQMYPKMNLSPGQTEVIKKEYERRFGETPTDD